MEENNTVMYTISDEIMNKLVKGYSRNEYRKGFINGGIAASIVTSSIFAGVLGIAGLVWVGNQVVKEIKEGTNNGHITVSENKPEE